MVRFNIYEAWGRITSSYASNDIVFSEQLDVRDYYQEGLTYIGYIDFDEALLFAGEDIIYGRNMYNKLLIKCENNKYEYVSKRLELTKDKYCILHLDGWSMNLGKINEGRPC